MNQRKRTNRPSGRRMRRRRGRVRGRLSLVPTVCLLLVLCIHGAKLSAQSAAVSPGGSLPQPDISVRIPPEFSALSSDIAASARRQEPKQADTSASPDPVRPDNDSWNLLLVNTWNPLPADYSPSLTELKNGLCVDTRCYPDLQAMIDACRADGLSPVICSAYRTQEYQEQLFQNRVNSLTAQGYSRAGAEAEAGKSVAVPGTSEHQLGLAVDIVDRSNQHLDESQESTAVQKWLMEHSWEYGFILRYPSGKSEITGIIYEPWHYRYVGRTDAKEIHALEVCLEEYLDRVE